MSRLLVATGEALVRVDGREADVLLERPGLHAVAVDPGSPDRIAAGCRGAGVWESDDGGSTWRDAALPAPDVFSVAFGPDGALYAGCEPSALYVRRAGAPWLELAALRELPSAPTWSFPPRPWTSHVRWIAPSPHDAGVVLVGIELGGLMRTDDGGETWADHRPGAQRDVHALAWHPTEPGRAYEAAGGGAAKSRDGGETWEPADEGRDRHYTWALAVDPVDSGRWYVSAAPGPFEAHGSRPAQAALYRWSGDGPWEELDLGLPRPLEAMPYALAWSDGRLVAGLRDGRLLESEDGGDTWRDGAAAGLGRLVAMAA
ncbi:MAG: WD40/YVTN/BNR-like repeat-containing protein [Gaiellaceae bacterium]